MTPITPSSASRTCPARLVYFVLVTILPIDLVIPVAGSYCLTSPLRSTKTIRPSGKKVNSIGSSSLSTSTDLTKRFSSGACARTASEVHASEMASKKCFMVSLDLLFYKSDTIIGN